MALIQREWLQSVVAMGIPVGSSASCGLDREMKKVATGFFYQYPVSGDSGDLSEGFGLCLVTCRHVIEDTLGIGHDTILVRMNRVSQDEMEVYEMRLLEDEDGPAWHFHNEADVAVRPVEEKHLIRAGVRWESYNPAHDVLTRARAKRDGLCEGDGVFILVFPDGWQEGRQDYPVVRHGVLAQLQGWLNGDHETFLVDGSGFPGNSGGPVVTVPQSATLDATKPIGRSSLVGMVSKGKSRSISREDPRITESADLIEVVPVDAIDEAIRLARESAED